MNQSISSNRFWFTFAATISLLAVLPLSLGPFQRTLLLEILIWGLFACSFNILYGHTGMLSFGQSMFFGLGGYGAAWLLDSAHVSPLLAIPAGSLLACVAAMLTGLFLIRTRGHAFSLITLMFSLILYYLALSQSALTGGDDGYPIRVPDLHLGQSRIPVRGFWTPYILVLGFFSAGFLVYRWLIASSAWGRVLRGIRENEGHAEILGYEIPWCKFLAWVVAGGIAGLAGALYAVAFRYVNASWLHWTVSGDAVVWTLFGGKGTLLGPMVGAFLLILFKDTVSTWNEHLYPLFVGALVILVTLAAPSGVIGLLRRSIEWVRRRFIDTIPEGDFRQETPHPVRAVQGFAAAAHDQSDFVSCDLPPRGIERGSPNPACKQLPLLEVKDIVMEFGEVQVLGDITLALNDAQDPKESEAPQHRPSLIGPNGSGKSVLFDIILGRRAPTKGKVFLRSLDGNGMEDITKFPTWKRAKLGVTAMTQDANVFPQLTVSENLWLAVFSRQPVRRRFASARLMRDVDDRATSFLEWLDLTTVAHQAAGELSYGMKRILQFGTVLARQPTIMLLDEPTSGLSMAVVERITRLIASASAAPEQTPMQRRIEFVVEHDFRWVEKNASELFVLHGGSLIVNTYEDKMSVAEALADKTVQRAFLGRLD